MEKLNQIKDKIVALAKKTYRFLKANPFVTSLLCFGVAVFVLILVSMLVLHEFVTYHPIEYFLYPKGRTKSSIIYR